MPDPATAGTDAHVVASATTGDMSAAATRYHRRVPSHTNSVASDANWDTRSTKKACSLSRTQFIIIAVLVGLLLAGGIAGLVTWTLLKRAKDGNNVGVPNNTDLTITPSPDLPKSFYGITYTPLNSQYPECGDSLGDVVEDVKVLSQLTTRLRLYGMDCRQAEFTLEAIKLLKVNVKIVPTIWVDDNPVTYERQYNMFWDLLKTYGTDNILGVSVGNEAIYRKQSNATDLATRMADVRSQLRTRGYASIPVFTTDLGDNFKEDLVRASDQAWANVHPYFAGVEVSTAAKWTWDFYENFIGKPARAGGKIGVISETGWPTRGEAKQNSVPTTANLQRFLDDFLCATNTKGIPYYFFEAFDAPWKEARFTELEGYWGLLTKDRKPKVRFPECTTKAPSA